MLLSTPRRWAGVESDAYAIVRMLGTRSPLRYRTYAERGMCPTRGFLASIATWDTGPRGLAMPPDSPCGWATGPPVSRVPHLRTIRFAKSDAQSLHRYP